MLEIAVPRDLMARQTQFLCLLVAKPGLTRADYQRYIAVSYATAKRDLAELVAAGLIVPIGCTNTRRYALSPRLVLKGAEPDTDLIRTSDSTWGQVRIRFGPSPTHAHRSRA